MANSIRASRAAVFVPALLAFVACAGVQRPPSNAPAFADFAITVTTTSDGIDLACARGCAWTHLRFDSRPYAAPQAVDQFGMTSAPTESQSTVNRSSFLFTVQRTGDEVRLRGIHGIAWTSLGYECRAGMCRQAIDEYGMSDGNVR